jgi:hypothetical protein
MNAQCQDIIYAACGEANAMCSEALFKQTQSNNSLASYS